MEILTVALTEGRSPQRLLVALHGWGANYNDLAALAPYLNLPDYQLLFPNAPFPHPYAPGGRMWYSLDGDYSFQSSADFRNHPELAQSRTQLLDWLRSLESQTGVPLSRTILAGFSQGGAMTLDVGTQLPLGALMVLSGYLHAPLTPPAHPLPPILMVHGRYDPVVPLLAAQQAKAQLVQLGATVDYHEIDMGHEIQPVVLHFMQSFLREQLSFTGDAPETT